MTDKHPGKSAAGRLGLAKRWKNKEVERVARRDLAEFQIKKFRRKLEEALAVIDSTDVPG